MASGMYLPAKDDKATFSVCMQPFQRGQQVDNLLADMSRILRKYDRGVRADADIT
jgi:hypothetical protein